MRKSLYECFNANNREKYMCYTRYFSHMSCQCCDRGNHECDNFTQYRAIKLNDDFLKCNDVINTCTVNKNNRNVTSCSSECKEWNQFKSLDYKTTDIWNKNVLNENIHSSFICLAENIGFKIELIIFFFLGCILGIFIFQVFDKYKEKLNWKFLPKISNSIVRLINKFKKKSYSVFCFI